MKQAYGHRRICQLTSVLSVFILQLSASGLQSQVVLSEIMFDALGSEAHDEFIEIVNLSVSEAVDLTGWQLSDGTGFDQIVAVDNGTTLAPGQFAVILDGSYFGNSTAYDDLIPSTSLILTIDDLALGSGGLSNSSPENISLLNAESEVVSQHTYTLGNEMGFSEEKIDLSGPDSADNWADSRQLLGTPGAPNSVSPLRFDLATLPPDLVLTPEIIGAGESLTVEVRVRNLGLEAVDNFAVTLFEDFDGDSLVDIGEELASPFEFEGSLQPGASTTFTLVLENASSGRHTLSARLFSASDQDFSNNYTSKALLVSFRAGSLIINEIMYSPLPEQAEWIELYNPSNEMISIVEWGLSDSNAEDRALVAQAITIPANGFAVLGEDSTVLEFFSPPAGSFSVLQNWPSLNNGSDSVVLYDLTGLVIDRVDYDASWGGETGISLERINPDLSSNDRTNWSSSVTIAGGTPGSENSIFTRFLPEKTSLTVDPNPFSPDGDGKDDFTLIGYEIPLNTAVVNLKIYDIRGRLVRFLQNNRASGSRNAFIWDGRDDRNQIARIGLYIVFLQALNAEAGVLKTEKKTLVLAGQL